MYFCCNVICGFIFFLKNSSLTTLAMMIRNICICLLLLLIGNYHITKAQTAESAKALMDEQRYQEALNQYNIISEANPFNWNYKYKVAECHYRLKNYPEAITTLRLLMLKDSSNIDYYRLLGNSYDLNEDYQMAVNTFRKAIRRFPHEGKLYLDLGLVEYLRNNFSQARDVWEEGIVAQPYYPDTYYFLTKLYADSDAKLWALIYGEFFLNLEKSTERFQEISALLYQTYIAYLRNDEPVEPAVSFNDTQYNNFEIAFNHLIDQLRSEGKINFKKDSGLVPEGSYMNYLSLFRIAFLEKWTLQYAPKIPMSLYEWQQRLHNKSLFHAYNHWLFSFGDTQYVVAWQQFYKQEYEDFLMHFFVNQLTIDVEHYVVRKKYE